ncbi:MAG: serine/threonine protein kinase [Labilithrix sp.]|nr:serine/threonine protein kinase [Labilithrix sp.]
MVEVGQVISGKYKLLRLLGDGGMGAVYEAEHLTLGTHVAIKVLHSDLARRTGIAERFLQEARVSAQIRSPHVVQVIDVDRTADDVAYLVMELLQGEPLSGVVKRQQKLAVGTACEYAVQILQALEAAHALGVIHRDLKPDNVFVTFQGGKSILKLIDFGIAKLKTAQAGQTKNLTVAGMLMGTPEYMAPEQAYSADKVDVRADLYAVGVMLYEMLSGQAPATADDPRVLVLKVERGEVTPLVQAAPGIEPQLAGFVHRAMAPRPELRFANATRRCASPSRTSQAASARAPARGGGRRRRNGRRSRRPAPPAPRRRVGRAARIGTGHGHWARPSTPRSPTRPPPGSRAARRQRPRQRRDRRRAPPLAAVGASITRPRTAHHEPAHPRTPSPRTSRRARRREGWIGPPRHRAGARRARARRRRRRRVRRRDAGADAGGARAADVRDRAVDAVDAVDAADDAGDDHHHPRHAAHDVDGRPADARAGAFADARAEEGRRRRRASSARRRRWRRRRPACRRRGHAGADHHRDPLRDVPVPGAEAAVLSAGSAVAAAEHRSVPVAAVGSVR